MSGHKIIEGLKEAVAGDMTRVTIEGQTWLRADTMAAVPCPYCLGSGRLMRFVGISEPFAGLPEHHQPKSRGF